MAPAVSVAEDGLVMHQWEERSLILGRHILGPCVGKKVCCGGNGWVGRGTHS